MKLKFYFLLTLCTIFLTDKNNLQAQDSTTSTTDFSELSESFLKRLKSKKDTEDLQNILANTTIKELDNALDTNDKRLAFWINIYNAYIQVILQKNPDLYADRGSFFKKKQITIAGETVSFAKIEHGIIRKSQYEYGLGYIRKWFPNKFERKLRVNKPVYNVHFALNCGAIDCPPVAIYEWERLDEQFKKGTKTYLERTTEYNADAKEVAVTSLFNWFRGDFGGKCGVNKILKKNGLIPLTKGIDLTYKNYDWTLDLDNFIDL
ncbi:DUF547 domain-containing protein [Maribacter sp. ACAM166]|uniref:DUF547 domain-containing protein n=1 Tax=Maribacter sp. ACAM166 TaxID=2508996 RepID=UPI0010FCDEA7|nr:DUF547 domain-containing protein [Maribacter sp. ACAM166]TLP71244.1 DUF547 domain-containing protein [Maribacter sp. ACAM166]